MEQQKLIQIKVIHQILILKIKMKKKKTKEKRLIKVKLVNQIKEIHLNKILKKKIH